MTPAAEIAVRKLFVAPVSPTTVVPIVPAGLMSCNLAFVESNHEALKPAPGVEGAATWAAVIIPVTPTAKMSAFLAAFWK